MRYLAACAAVLALACSTASAAITAFWEPRPINAMAIAADPVLGTQQTWSLMITNTDGHWASAGMRATLPAGNVFYQVPVTRGGGDTHPNPAFFPVFPDLEFDTYVSSARNQQGQNAPSVLGSFPEDMPPLSFGGSMDAIPGTFAVAWGDPMATSGPGPGTYEIARLTFPQGVLPQILPTSRTSQVVPDNTTNIPQIPEPSTLGLVAVAGMLAIRRRRAA